MPATIQTIEKPIRARAWDTSTGEHLSGEWLSDPTFTLSAASGDQAESTSGDFWQTGQDVMIDADGDTDSGPCVIIGPDDPDNDHVASILVGWNQQTIKGSGTSDMGDIQPGDKFQVTYTLANPASGSFPSGTSNPGVVVQIFSISTGGDGNHDPLKHTVWRGQGTKRTSAGTYTEDVTVDTFRPLSAETHYNNAMMMTGTNAEDWGSTDSIRLSNISFKRYESFGNNNQGQIYSGRVLEFDGVTDYIDTGYVFSSTAHTICVWAKVIDTVNNKFIFDARDGNNDGVILYFNGDEQLGYLVNNTDLIISDKYINQWIRIVATSDGSTQSLYINGQLHSSQSISETISVTGEARIGAISYDTASSFF